MGATDVLPDTRSAFVKFLKQDKKLTLPSRGDCPRVLLVDEVDVFFGDSFYGQAYMCVSYVH